MTEKTPLEDRFWPKVNKGESDECWEWQAATNYAGYGIIGLGSRDEGNERAHRVVMMLEGYDIDDKQVNHRCGTPSCVNPNHLYIGSQSDNIQDAIEHGTKRVGENHPTAKLSTNDVEEIRQRAEEGEYHRKIAKDYNVNRRHITRIVNGKRRYKHD